METRDQHIAHRVSGAEQAVVVVLLAGPPRPRSVEGVNVWGARLVGKNGEHVQALRQLAVSLLQVVTDDLQSLQQDLIDWAKQQDLDEAYRRAKPMA